MKSGFLIRAIAVVISLSFTFKTMDVSNTTC